MMTAAGLETKEHSDVKEVVWEKTILNSTLCSICAVTGQTMKEAMENPHTLDLVVKVLKEGLAVAKADGYDFGDKALTRFVSYLKKGGAHKPSMLIDVERRRPTEVDFMSGAIVLIPIYVFFVWFSKPTLLGWLGYFGVLLFIPGILGGLLSILIFNRKIMETKNCGCS